VATVKPPAKAGPAVPAVLVARAAAAVMAVSEERPATAVTLAAVVAAEL
jgi:hypothetical protein